MNKDKKKIGIFSVVTDDFAAGFIAMERSLRRHNPTWDYVVHAIYEDLRCPLSQESQALISALCENVVFLEANPGDYTDVFAYARNVLRTPDRLMPAFYILEAFRRVEFDKVVCLDSDMIVLGPLDELVSTPGEFIAVQAKADDGREPRTFINTGVMVATSPWLGLLGPEQILDACEGKNYVPGSGKADQALLNMALSLDDMELLDDRFNYTKRIALTEMSASEPIAAQALLARQDARILHFVGEKPWLPKRRRSERAYSPFEKLWHDEIERINDQRLNALIQRQMRNWVAKQARARWTTMRSYPRRAARTLFKGYAKVARLLLNLATGGYLGRIDRQQRNILQELLREREALKALEFAHKDNGPLSSE